MKVGSDQQPGLPVPTFFGLACLAVCLLFVSLPLLAIEQVVEPGLEHQPVSAGMEYVEDPTGRLDIKELLNAESDWQLNGKPAFNQSYSGSAWWLRLSLINPSESHLSRILELNYAVLDYVDVYWVEGEEVIRHEAMGDRLPFARRLLEHRYFLVPLEWSAGESLTLYLRIQTSSAVQAPLTLWDVGAFHVHDATRTLLYGLLFGSLLVIAAYNLLLFVGLREMTYLLYVGYVVCMAVFLATLDGFSFQYLWRYYPGINNYSMILSLAGVVAFGAAFTQRFLRTRLHAPHTHRLLAIALFGACLLAVASIVLTYRLNIVALIGWAAITCLLCLWAGVCSWYLKLAMARYYTIAWVSMLAGGLILALSKMDVLPVTRFTRYATHVGTFLEVMLLSFALTERINTERRLRYEAQDEALNAIQHANSELETRVKERTGELERLTRQLRELSNTDQLTGIYNRRFLDGMVEREWRRARRYGRSLALVMLDIDRFKPINDNYGHGAGDDCIKLVAEHIGRGRRSLADIPARYGGEEFCILLPETGLDGAEKVAEQIRKGVEQAEFDINGEVLKITLSAGVYSMIPSAKDKKSQLFEKADKALYQAKAQGRNQVVVYSPAAPWARSDVASSNPKA